MNLWVKVDPSQRMEFFNENQGSKDKHSQLGMTMDRIL